MIHTKPADPQVAVHGSEAKPSAQQGLRVLEGKNPPPVPPECGIAIACDQPDAAGGVRGEQNFRPPEIMFP